MRVLVFEYVFEVTGHRIPYASLICDAIASRGDCPILALPQSVSGDETLQAYLPPDRGGYLHPYRATQYRRPGLIAREMTRSLLDVLSQVLLDYGLVPNGDLIAF